GEQVGGEAVPQRVRAHLAREPGRAGVAIDDLVEALARERAAPEVHEKPWLLARSHERRAPAAQIDLNRLHGLAADRHDARLRALAEHAGDALVQVEMPPIGPDRLRSAQHARVRLLQYHWLTR